MARSTYDDFIIKEKIGSGSYGVVFKVVRKLDRMTYAMKEIDLAGMSRKEQEECIRETRVLSSLDSDYIIKYYDSFLERGRLYIITEYASNGNLHDYIKRQKQKLSEDLIWKLFLQILLGLNHMHSKKILHRDIKTLNVFLDDDLNVKLGDMGVAKILSTHTNFAKTIVGTPYYLSPELCEDKPYNEKSDVWALGVVLYECCVQRHPFDADNQGALILKILRGKYPPVAGYSNEVAEVIKCCLTQNANRRPNTFKLLLHPAVRHKAGDLGIIMPDQATLLPLAERSSTGKVARSSNTNNKVPAAPVAQQQPPSTAGVGRQSASQQQGEVPSSRGVTAEQQAVKELPEKPGQGGVIRVVGDMNQPPVMTIEDISSPTGAIPVATNPDKAFVFGSTVKSSDVSKAQQQQAPATQVDVSVTNMDLSATMPARKPSADIRVSQNGAAPKDAASILDSASPQASTPNGNAAGANWWVAAVPSIATPQEGATPSASPPMPQTPSAAAAEGGQGVAGARHAWSTAAQDPASSPDIGGLHIDEEEEEEEENNPYDQPYRSFNEEDGTDEGELGDEEYEEDGAGQDGQGQEEDGEEYDDDEYDEGDYDDDGVEEDDVLMSPDGQVQGGSAGGAWQPDPGRVQHMRSAMMIQRAACLDLIGDKAFNELYALLKSNQVDEASMTDLSRLVFKIIPYDKSEVIQMMYKLLYLESQLETGA